MKIAFWSEEDGCGTTSGMAAVASVCSDVLSWNTILMQSRNQEGDLRQKLGAGVSAESVVREEHTCDRQDQWDLLCRLARDKRLTAAKLWEHLVPVVQGHMYYLPQGEYKKRKTYSESAKAGMYQVIRYAEQMADFLFIDCGNGRDEMSDFLLSRADVVVVNLSQERQNLDAYFQNRHVFRGNVIYLMNQYQNGSVYNKKNLNRLFCLCEEELAVIPHNPVFRYVSEKGKLEHFIRRHMHCRIYDRQFYFMQELMQTTGMILKAAGKEFHTRPLAAGSSQRGKGACCSKRMCKKVRPPPLTPAAGFVFVRFGFY